MQKAAKDTDTDRQREDWHTHREWWIYTYICIYRKTVACGWNYPQALCQISFPALQSLENQQQQKNQMTEFKSLK